MNKKQLQFHIKSDDYFGTLATILNFIKENSIKQNKIFDSIISELLFLQKNYKIIKKTKE